MYAVAAIQLEIGILIGRALRFMSIIFIQRMSAQRAFLSPTGPADRHPSKLSFVEKLELDFVKKLELDGRRSRIKKIDRLRLNIHRFLGRRTRLDMLTARR